MRPFRLRPAATLAAACALGLAGCASPQGPATPPPQPSSPTASAAHDPTELVGAWTVRDTGTADDGQVVYLSSYSTVYRPCGTTDVLVIAAPDGALRAQVLGSSGNCSEAADAAWLTRAVGFTVAGTQAQLTDSAGRVTARLAAGGTPAIADNVWAGAVVVPTLDSNQVQRLSASRPALQAGLSAPVAHDLVGRWVPREVSQANAEAHIELKSDGTWTGSDGCNGLQGIWHVGSEGWWQAIAGAQTEIGCDNIDLAATVSQASQVALADAGSTLVLLDGGSEVARLSAG